MRLVCALSLLAALAAAGDLVHLKNGRVLKGRVVDESGDAIVIDLGGGRMTIPREKVRLLERGATAAPRKLTTVRDEWFLVLHRERVAGWRRVVHTERPGRVTVEERTVFFQPGGGIDIDTRRVESADGEGRPVEFLLMETYGHKTEIVSGKLGRGVWTVHVTRDGTTKVGDLAGIDGDWVLPLPAWSRFLAAARPGETRSLRALDIRRLKPVSLVLRRDADAPAPHQSAGRCRSLRLDGGVTRTRALFRPGKGSVAVELNGATLVARRSTRERVELARKAHAPATRTSADLKRATHHPLQRRLMAKPKPQRVIHARAGIELTAPDAGWAAQRFPVGRGRVLLLEKVGLFGTLEVFCYPLPDQRGSLEECFARAVARLRLTARKSARHGPVVGRAVAGFPGRTAMYSARHRGEDLRCRLTVVRLSDRYLVVVAAAPERRWKWADEDFAAIMASLKLAK